MARLNLICNGMMLFNEVRDSIRIVIPDIPGHVRKFCPNTTPAKDQLVDVPIGDYQLRVPGSNSARLADLLDSAGYIQLDGKKVDFDETGARKISAVITVPKPTIIRLYRASEPLANFDMLGNCRPCVTRVPSIAHDIVVLSYTNLPVQAPVEIGPSSGKPLAQSVATPLIPINWILYSNERLRFPLPADVALIPDEELNILLAPMRHPTPLNDFLKVKADSGMAQPQPTTLSLSGIGKKDGPMDTAIGMDAIHQFLYHELPDTQGGTIVTPRSGEPGCTGAALATL